MHKAREVRAAQRAAGLMDRSGAEGMVWLAEGVACGEW